MTIFMLKFMDAKDTGFYRYQTLVFGRRKLHLDQPRIMGILNVTPDSFSDGNQHFSLEKALLQAEKMIGEGADIIDAGGYSSRPGADDVTVEEEIRRVIPVIGAIHQKWPEQFISVDTFRAEVARKAVEAGACMVNDISAGNLDNRMIATVAELGTPYVLMHMKGTPKTMQNEPQYENVVEDINRFFEKKLQELRTAGVDQVILDPGFGFGKTPEHNQQIAAEFKAFKTNGLPILAGVSKKSFIQKMYGTLPVQVLEGTLKVNEDLVRKGAVIMRVHDVREHREMVERIKITG